jgi:hypothetical protein
MFFGRRRGDESQISCFFVSQSETPHVVTYIFYRLSGEVFYVPRVFGNTRDGIGWTRYRIK